MRRLSQLNSIGYHLMRLIESSSGQVEYTTRNSTLSQTLHFTCAELNALIMSNYYITHIISHIVLWNFVLFGGLLMQLNSTFKFSVWIKKLKMSIQVD